MAKVSNETKSERFAKAYHSILFNTQLRPASRLLLIYALDNKPEWKFVAKNAGVKLKLSTKVMTRVLNELENSGYLIRKKLSRPDRKFDYSYKFLLTPLPPDAIKKKQKPNAKKNTGANTLKVPQPDTHKDTGTGNPKVIKPVAETDPYYHTTSNHTNGNHTPNHTIKSKEEISTERKEKLWKNFLENSAKYTKDDFPKNIFPLIESQKGLSEADAKEVKHRIYRFFWPEKKEDSTGNSKTSVV